MPFYLGLDLGQAADPTVAVILDAQGPRLARSYAIRHIEPYPLGISYPAIIVSVRDLMGRAPLAGDCTLVIDQTGVGRAVYDMFKEAGLKPIGVTITPGKSWHQEAFDQYYVAKELLVGTVQKFLQSDRLRSSLLVKHSRVLKRELQGFRVRVTKALNEVYGPDVRESQHDDMVLATACALWYAEHHVPAASVDPATMFKLWREAGVAPEQASAWRPALWTRRRIG